MPDPATPLEEAMALLTVTTTTLAGSMHALMGSQSQFLRAASGADSNIALSQATPLLHSEVAEARKVDNTVDDKHRNGLLATLPVVDCVVDLLSLCYLGMK